MSVAENIAEIVALYQKHGWILRRLLLTPTSKASAPNIPTSVVITEFPVNAAWFSRPPSDAGIPWEIRYLGETPFALVENLDEADPDFEDKLHLSEAKLIAAVTAKRSRSM